jgi:hypothetical protein
MYSYKTDTKIILSYLYDLLAIKNPDIECEQDGIERKHFRDYRKENSDYMFLHNFIPVSGKYNIDDIEIEICDFILNGKIQTFEFKEEFFHIKKVILKSSSKEKITMFIENAINKKFKEKRDKFAEISGDKIMKKKWPENCKMTI